MKPTKKAKDTFLPGCPWLPWLPRGSMLFQPNDREREVKQCVRLFYVIFLSNQICA